MRYPVPLLGLLIVFFLFPRQTVLSQEIYGTSDTFYQTTENKSDEGTDSSWSMVLGNYLGFKNTISPNMNYSFDVRTIVNETDIHKNTTIYPNGQFNLNNNFFDAGLGYQRTERDPSDGPRFTSSSWNCNINSRLEKIPQIRLQYSQDKNYDHLSVHNSDDESKRFFGSVQYKYDFINMQFNYNRRDSDDYVQDTVQESENLLGKVDVRKSFFNNKLFLNSEYGWNRNTNDTNERRAYFGLYEHDTTPASDSLNETESLIDDDYVTSTGIDIGSTGDTYQNIGIDLDSSQAGKTIHLYTTSNYNPSLSNSYFTWAVYSGDDGTDWDLVTSNAGFDYNELKNRFEISFPSQEARYFKAVNTSHDPRSIVGSVYITEIKILGKKGEEQKTTTSGWETTSNITFRPLDRLTLGYNFAYDFTENDPGSLEDTEKNHGVNVSCKLHEYLFSSAQYWTRTDTSEGKRNKNDSYSVQFNSSPLDTLSMSVSFNHSEMEGNEIKAPGEVEKTETETDSYLFHLTATLWEGVDFSSDFHLTQSESADESESTGRSIDLDLDMDLTKNTTLELGFTRNWQDKDEVSKEEGAKKTEKTENTHFDMTLSYSPSDVLYLRTDFDLDDTGDGTDTSYGFNISWLPTTKLQLNINSSFEQSDEKTSSVNLDLSWNISRYIIMRCGFNYSKSENESEDESQTVYTRISTRF